MTIKEMEEQIDLLNLDKLEVKMKKGRQVHFFVCGDPESYEESDGKYYGNLIVFDEKGRAWTLAKQKWEKGGSFDVHFGKNTGVLFLKGFKMSRYPNLDLAEEGGK